jgi:hypothetical protein
MPMFEIYDPLTPGQDRMTNVNLSRCDRAHRQTEVLLNRIDRLVREANKVWVYVV